VTAEVGMAFWWMRRGVCHTEGSTGKKFSGASLAAFHERGFAAGSLPGLAGDLHRRRGSTVQKIEWLALIPYLYMIKSEGAQRRCRPLEALDPPALVARSARVLLGKGRGGHFERQGTAV